MITLQQLKEMPPHTIFAQGEIENSPEGIYMTDTYIGRKLIWIAKRGGIHDWAIYCHWADESNVEYVKKYGQKVSDKKNIIKLVACDKEALKMYRY